MQAKFLWLFRALAIAAAALATIQPVLGPLALFRRADPPDYETIHLVLGGILYNLVILLAILAPFTGLRRRWLVLGICVAQYALMHGQLLLGLESNDDVQLLAYHIPLGVLIFFIAYLTLGMSFGLRFEPRAATAQRQD